jgi:hypothetical protein
MRLGSVGNAEGEKERETMKGPAGGGGKRRGIGKSVILGGAFVVVLAALVIYASSGLGGHTCEVCIRYGGETACRKADGKTREEATRTATDTACAVLASGMTETLKCTNTRPESQSCDGGYSGMASGR